MQPVRNTGLGKSGPRILPRVLVTQEAMDAMDKGYGKTLDRSSARKVGEFWSIELGKDVQERLVKMALHKETLSDTIIRLVHMHTSRGDS